MVVQKSKNIGSKAKKLKEKPKQKFESFPQQLKKLKVPKLASIGIFSGNAAETTATVSSDPFGNEDHVAASEFYAALHKWRDLNLSESFTELSRKIHNLCQTFTQLLHNSDRIISTLKEYGNQEISTESFHSLEPILDLWHAIARDLRLDLSSKFWPHIKDFLSLCFTAMTVKDISVIRMSYGSISGVMKILQKSKIQSNLQLVQTILTELDNFDKARKILPKQTLKFIALAISQIARKASDRQSIFTQLLADLARGKDCTFFGNIFISTCADPYPNTKNWELVVRLSFENLDKSRNLSFWTETISLLNSDYPDAGSEFFEILASFIINRACEMNNEGLKILEQILKYHQQPADLQEFGLNIWNRDVEADIALETWQCLFQRLLHCHKKDEDFLKKMIRNFMTCKFLTMKAKCDIVNSSLSRTLSSFESLISEVFKHFESCLDDELPLITTTVISLASHESWNASHLLLPDSIIRTMLLEIKSSFNFNENNPFLQCLAHVKISNVKLVLDCIQPLENSFDQLLEQNVLNLIRLREKCKKLSDSNFLTKAIPVVSAKCDSVKISEAISLVCMANSQLSLKIINEHCPDLIGRLVHNLFAPNSRDMKLNNLRALCSLKSNNILESLLQSESVQPDVASYRERLRYLNCVQELESEEPLVQEAYLRILVANFGENFSLLWKPCAEYLVDCEEKLPESVFWGTIFKIFDSLLAYKSLTKEEENVKNKLLESFCSMNKLNEKNCQSLGEIFIKSFTVSDPPKGHRKTVQVFLKLFSKFNHQLTAKLNKDLINIAFDLMKSRENFLQSAASTFVCSQYKKVRAYQEILTNLSDPSKQKTEYHSLHENFPQGVESLNINVKKAIINLTVGCLKNTSKEKNTKQKSMRKLIMESCALLDKQLLFEILETAIEDEMRVDEEKKSAIGKLEMLIDLCMLSKNLLEVKNGTQVALWIVQLMVKWVGLVKVKKISNARSKVLVKMGQVFKGCKKLPLNLLTEYKFFEHCIFPFCESEMITGKMIKLFSLWMNLESLDYFTVTFYDTTLIHVIAKFLDQAPSEVDPKLLDLCSELLIKLEENNQITEIQTLSQPMTKALIFWLSAKKSRITVKSGDRFDAARIILASNTSTPETLDNLGNLLSSTVVPLNDANVRDWFGSIKESLDKREEICEKLFKFLVTLKNDEYRYKLGIVLQKRLNLEVSSSKDVLEPHQLASQCSNFGRNELLFSLYICLASINTNAIDKSMQGLDAILNILEVVKPTEEFPHLVQNHLLGPVKHGLRQKEENVHNCYLSLMRFLVLNFDKGSFTELKQLTDNSEDEVDFFENMKHLQIHRRARAMRRLAKMLDEKLVTFSSPAITNYLIPLGSRYIMNPSFISHSDLVEAAISLIGSSCCFMTSGSYLKLLDQFISMESTERPMKKQKFHVISKLLNNFSFQNESLFENHESKTIQLLKKCLSLLKQDEEDGSLNVYAPIAKLSSFQKTSDTYVQNVIFEACNKLKSKQFKTRNLVRSAIADVMKVLGPNYLYFLCSTLDTALQKGYQKHVLIQSVGYLLGGMEEDLTPETVEPLVSRSLEWVSIELYADFASEKKVAAIIKKTPEAKSVSSYNILRILARFVDKSYFQDILAAICPPKKKIEHIEKARKAFNHILTGIGQNQTLESSERVTLAKYVMSDTLGGKWNYLGATVKSILHEFGLNLILNEIRSGSFIESSESVLNLVVNALDFAYLDVILVSLRILCLCLPQNEFENYFQEPGVLKSIATKMCLFLRKYARSKDNRPFTLACKAIEKILIKFRASFDGEELSLVKTMCLTELEKYPVECARVLSALVDIANSDEKMELSRSICKFYLTSNQRKVHENLRHLLHMKRQRSFSLKFMMENMEYGILDGRLRAIRYLHHFLETDNSVSEDLLRKIFFLATHRLVNEEDKDARSDLEAVIKSIFLQPNHTKGPMNVRQSVLDWSCSKEPLHQLIASKMAILTAQLNEGKELCLKIIRNLRKRPENLNDTNRCGAVLRANLFEAMTEFLSYPQVGKVMKVDVMKEFREDAISSLLSPVQALREKTVEFVSVCLENSKLLSDWNQDEACSRTFVNAIELLRQFPTGNLETLLVKLWRNHFASKDPKVFMDRLFKTFNYEKVEVSLEFERRKLILDVLSNIDITEDLIGTSIIPILYKNQHIQEIEEQIQSLMKKYESSMGKETFDIAVKSVKLKKKSLQFGQKRSTISSDYVPRKKRKNRH